MRRSIPWQTYATLALAFVASASLITALVIGIHPLAEVRWGFHTPLRFCGQLLDSAEFRGLVASALVLSFIGLHVWLASKAWRRSARRVDQLTGILASLPQAGFSPQLRRVLRETETLGHVILVQSDEAFVFTAGLKEPHIYLSTGVVHRLNDDELRAVLLHENQHSLARDPRRMQFLIALRAATPYLPATHALVRACLRQAEYDADDAALRRAASVPALLGAFVKLAPAAVAGLAVARYSDFASARIARLTSSQETGTWELLGIVPALSASLLVLALPPLLALGLTEIHSFAAVVP